MPDPADDIDSIATEIAPRMTSLQVIHLALVAGVTVFLVVMLVQGPAGPEGRGAFGPVALICAAAGAAMSFVLPSIFRGAGLAPWRGKEEIPLEALLGPYSTGHIAGMALLESAGFLACFALLGAPWNVRRVLVVIPIGILALMIARFPRPRAVAEWIASTREALVAGEGDRPRG